MGKVQKEGESPLKATELAFNLSLSLYKVK